MFEIKTNMLQLWLQIRNPNRLPSSEGQHQNPYNATDRQIDEDVIPQDFIDHGSAPSRGYNSTYNGGAKDSLWNTRRKIPDGLSGRKSEGGDDDEDKKGNRDENSGSGGGGDDGDKGWISGVMSAGVKVDISTSPMLEVARPLPVTKRRQGILKSVWNSGVVLERLRSEAVYAVESVLFDIFPGLEGPTQAVSDSDQKRRHKVIDYRLRMQGRLAHRDYEQMLQMKVRFEEKQRLRQLQIDELVERREYVRRSVDDSLLPEEVRPIRLRRTWESVTMWKDQRRRRWVIHVPVNTSWDDLG